MFDASGYREENIRLTSKSQGSRDVSLQFYLPEKGSKAAVFRFGAPGNAHLSLTPYLFQVSRTPNTTNFDNNTRAGVDEYVRTSHDVRSKTFRWVYQREDGRLVLGDITGPVDRNRPKEYELSGPEIREDCEGFQRMRNSALRALKSVYKSSGYVPVETEESREVVVAQ